MFTLQVNELHKILSDNDNFKEYLKEQFKEEYEVEIKTFFDKILEIVGNLNSLIASHNLGDEKSL